MIKRLKIRFITLAVSALFLLLLLTVGGMNIINYTETVRDADELLTMVTQGRGGPQPPVDTRYFSVLTDSNGEPIAEDTRGIVDSRTALSYVQRAKGARGFVDQFRFVRIKEGADTRIAFLDCGRELSSFYSFLRISVTMSVIALAAVAAILIFLSERIIMPIAESYRKQKRFITDAGHEIKTPLTIINANIDLLEMEQGENEYISDIRGQTARLTALVSDLVYLARMEEAENTLTKLDIPVSDIVQETVLPFRARALTEGKELVTDIQPMLSMKGDHKAICQLISILTDNAFKYSPRGGRVSITFKKLKGVITLEVYNTVSGEVDSDVLPHVFDRFYRADSSRNSKTGGHGIGLSVAQAIVAAHGGRIRARTADRHSFTVTVDF